MSELITVGSYGFRRNNVYYFNDTIFQNFTSFRRGFIQKRIHYPNDPILLVINSRGGTAWINYEVPELMNKGIITLGFELVASAAVDFLQVGVTRYSHPSTKYFLHSTTLDRRRVTEDDIKQGIGLIPPDDPLAMKLGKSAEEIREAYKEDTWLNSKQALETSIVDEIVDIPDKLETKLRQTPKGTIGFLKPNY